MQLKDERKTNIAEDSENTAVTSDEIVLDIDEFIGSHNSQNYDSFELEELELMKKDLVKAMNSALSAGDYTTAFVNAMKLRMGWYSELVDEIDQCIETCAGHDIEGAWIIEVGKYINTDTGQIEAAAFPYLKQLAEVGYIDSFRWLADCYYYGIGCEKDLDEADVLYAEGILFDKCEYCSGKYQELHPELRDYDGNELISCIGSGNERQSDMARIRLAEHILDGELGLYKVETAYELIKNAVHNSEDGVAYLRLGECLLSGIGTEPDPIIARELFDKAIKQLSQVDTDMLRESFHEDLDFDELISKAKTLRDRANQIINETSEWDIMMEHDGITDPEIIYYNWECKKSTHIKREERNKIKREDGYFSEETVRRFKEYLKQRNTNKDLGLLTVHNFECVIDKEYSYDDVEEITDKYIKLPDTEIKYDDCHVDWRYAMDPSMNGRICIGERNALTDPKYMKFTVWGKILIILFHNGDDFYMMLERLRDQGVDMFDLS